MTIGIGEYPEPILALYATCDDFDRQAHKPPPRKISTTRSSAQFLPSFLPPLSLDLRLFHDTFDYTRPRMRCNSLHHIFVTLLFLLSVNAFPLRLFQRQSTHELTAGSSNDDIRCEDARDCAAAGFGIPSNSHYKCNRKGICTYGQLSFACSTTQAILTLICRLQLQLHEFGRCLLVKRNSFDFLQLHSFSLCDFDSPSHPSPSDNYSYRR